MIFRGWHRLHRLHTTVCVTILNNYPLPSLCLAWLPASPTTTNSHQLSVGTRRINKQTAGLWAQSTRALWLAVLTGFIRGSWWGLLLSAQFLSGPVRAICLVPGGWLGQHCPGWIMSDITVLTPHPHLRPHPSYRAAPLPVQVKNVG